MTLHELWDDLVPPERRWLGLLVFCSIFAHGVFFFIFKITPPGSQGLPRRPSQVTLLAATPSIIWLDWRDPSSIALPRSPLPRVSPPSEFPGLPDRYTDLSELSGQLQVGSLKDTRVPLSERSTKEFVPETLKPSKVVVENPPSPAGTEIQFLGTLAGREPVFRPELPKPPVSDVLRVTVLNVGINASGTVDAIMVEETSLDTSVDQLAVTTLRQWKFKPRKVQGQEIDWGKVIVYWDYQGKPKPVAPPSP
jgi:TonB family protein